MRRIAPWLACGVIGMAVFGMGCQNTAEGVKQDSAEIGQNTADAARKVDAKAAEVGAKVDAKAAEVGTKVDQTAAAVGQDVKNAGQTVTTAAAGAGKAVTDATKNAGAKMAVSPSVLGVIAKDPQLTAPGNQVEVKTKDGVVHLQGYVTSQALKDHASALAKQEMTRIQAKETLQNELQVKK